MSNTNILSILKQHWGHDSFRYPQEEIITQILNKQDVLGLLPTGLGKSTLYQIPSLVLEGTTLVISPLKSLQKDQVDACIQRGIPAGLLNSDTGVKARRKLLSQIEDNSLKLLYISPETFFSDSFSDFKNKLKSVPLIAVDEAHCFRGTSLVSTNFGKISFTELQTTLKRYPDRKVYVKSFNTTSKSIEYKQVLNLFQNPFKKLQRTYISNGSYIDSTLDHVFFTTKGEKIASNLTKTDFLMTSDGSDKKLSHKIVKTELIEDVDEFLYDIEVEDNHNYYITTKTNVSNTDTEALVHNCCSTWSDFRSAYQKIYLARQDYYPDATLLAVTATADTNVVNDIIKYTGLKDNFKTYKTTFDRPTISLNVIKMLNKSNTLKTVIQLMNKHKGQAGIVFCNSVKETEQYSELLKSLGKNVDYFHAKVRKKEKERIQEEFISGKIETIFATNAFGMGVDKAQPLDSLVLTPEGYKEIRYIKEGDKVLTNDSSVATVVKTHDVPQTDLVKVTFEDGTSTYCATDHLWSLIEDDHLIVRDTNYLLRHNNIDHFIPAFRLQNYTTKIKNEILTKLSKYSFRKSTNLENNISFSVSSYFQYEEVRSEFLQYGCTFLYSSGIVTIFFPFTLSSPSKSISLTRKIINTEIFSLKVDMKCITIDSFNSLYVTNDYIVTHNCDIRYVIHIGAPSNFEDYSQQFGRASRDLKPSTAYLLYTPSSYNTSLFLIRKSTLDPNRLKIKIQKLTKFHEFCSKNICRRKALLANFGETYKKDNCQSCDVCLNKENF